KYIVYTWAESDTLTGGVKWNTKPNIKARLIDTDTYLISNTKLNLTQGTNSLVSNIATFHFVAPTFSFVNNNSGINIKLPLTVSNNQLWASLTSCDHWFAAADLSFSSSMHSFTSSIATTGIIQQQIANYNLLVYPNPVKDYLTIKCPESFAKITITNLLGQTFYQNDNFDTSQNIDLSTLSKAVYFLKVEIGRGQKVIKIVKD
ncbi:MAG: T9SS type A sorting domain-containing protein, partial [Bacteroidota bacterium]